MFPYLAGEAQTPEAQQQYSTVKQQFPVSRLANELGLCRAFASWKEFVVMSSDKRAKVQRASQACFASSLQRAWTTWRTHVHRQHLLRKALEGRQVSLSGCAVCVLVTYS